MARRYPSRSRLSRRVEKQSRKTLFLSILGIIAVIIFIFKLGIPLLIRFSVLVGDVSQTAESEEKKKSSVLVPPQLFPLPSATNSATIKIEGTGTKEGDIEIFLNGKLIERLETDENGNFLLESVRLEEGTNMLKARLRDNDGTESEFSNESSIVYDNTPPLLEVRSPSENQTVGKDEKTISVSGKTEERTKITVNGFWAVVDGSGNFSYSLPINPGENVVTIEAIDEAGNKITVGRIVTRAQ